MSTSNLADQAQTPTGAKDGVNAEDDRRAHLRDMWAGVAPSWERHAEYTDRRHAPDTERLLELTRPRPGERVLELACGAGGMSLAASPLVGAEGAVVGSDTVTEMTAVTARRAAARGLTNVRVRRLDLEDIDEPDASYDVVLCRDGLQFALEPDRALREIRRVLRPGGRVGVAVWASKERNPWLGLVFDTVSAQIGKPVPPPGLPGPFALADAEGLRALFAGADLPGVAVEELSLPMFSSSFDDWWARTSALAGPLTSLLDAMPQPARQALRSSLRTRAADYETLAGLEFPGVALIATAERRTGSRGGAGPV